MDVFTLRPNRYYDKRVREVCHAVKEHDIRAEREMAEYFLNLGFIKKGSVIIPAPQHTGDALYTKRIADIIAQNTGAKVSDILKCTPHETLYSLKKRKALVKPEFFLTGDVSGEDIYFLDNVLDTGTTYFAAKKLINNLKPLVYATTN